MSTKYRKGEFSIFPAIQLKGLDPYKQTVMAWLIFHTNADGTCFPSVDLLVDETGIGRSKLIKTLKELHSMGLIDKTIRNRVGGRQSTLYTVYKKRVPPSACDKLGQSPPDKLGTQVHETTCNHTQGTITSKDEYDTYSDKIWGSLQSLARKHGKVVFSKKKDYTSFFRDIGDMKTVSNTMDYLMSDANFKDQYGWKNAPFSVSKLKQDWNAVQDKVTKKTAQPKIKQEGFQ